MKNFWISHCPIYEQELRSRSGNIHGHTHFAELNNSRYYDIGLDKNNFKFIDFEEIKNIFKSRDLI
jgi:calcineurin-like phosphoesterase family protein